jgi:hypothetical protein
VNPDDLRRQAAAYRDTGPRREPPAERGERLATLARDGTEVRVTWDEYEGRPYLGIREWTLGPGGAAWPTKKGITVRLAELGTLAGAVADALDRATTHRGGGR